MGKFSAGLLCAVCCLPLQAADWLVVAKDKLRSVEIDRGSVMESDGGSRVAWGRIVLTEAQADKAGYKTLRALNRYDCRTRSFTLVKRVYLSADDRVLREENVDASNPSVVRPGTVDERFLNEICPLPASETAKKTSPASKRSLQEIADEAGRRAAAAGSTEGSERPFRRAELRLVKDEAPAASAKPAAPASAAAHGEITAKPPLNPEPKAASQEAPTPPVYRAAPPQYTPRPVAPRAPKAPASHAVAAAPVAHNPHAHWSYEGETGPEFWASLNPANSACSRGSRQSPIDIRDGIRVEQEELVFDYKPSYFRIVDNGHTIQVNYGSGSMLTVMGRNYELQQFHFHRPSEERVGGRAFAMVAHLVHKDLEGRLAVVAVLIEEGAANPLIQTLWNNLPLEKNEEYTPKASIRMSELLPARLDYYSYMGSLTTPPCTEGVLWLVLKQPMSLSREQIEIFSRFYSNNARPLQAQKGRVIKESR
ncbi:carbonic anhydrase [Uliginosibacterium aquaticum]|uniref:carbonic anhydrase n=1 Tax=Uliginosibacterium aquaticum TaxID=2731212 RepID=A0ABX2IQ83_9RHOO|nr:carbonic anhydrase family protein [Uliginosibacterium aquaticum]NSL56170.1 carbonic anhydrase family protein [Uliginosibacterium aquaticum]